MGRELPNDMAPIFDYGSLNDDHRAAAQEIVEILQSMGNDHVAHAISHRFKLKEPNRMDHTKTKIFEACQTADIFLGLQGFLVDHSDPDKTEYPIVSISEDIRKLETLYNIIKSS